MINYLPTTELPQKLQHQVPELKVRYIFDKTKQKLSLRKGEGTTLFCANLSLSHFLKVTQGHAEAHKQVLYLETGKFLLK